MTLMDQLRWALNLGRLHYAGKEKSEPLKNGSLYVKSLLTSVTGWGEIAFIARCAVNQTSGAVAFSDLICSDTR